MNQVTEFINKLFSSAGFPPRWQCGKWTEFHGWFYIISDTLISTAYFAIPLIIIRFISKRHDTKFLRLYFLFSAFILACGTTHLLDAITFWYPVYRLNALIRFITGILSWVTVFYLIKNLPIAFSLKTTRQLEDEIALRKNAEEELRNNNVMLNGAREELITLLEKEKKLNEMKSRFVAFASHEFRTPLTHILSSAELIKMYPGAEQQESRVKHVDRISAAVGNLTDILNDFLSVEQLESGAYEISSREFNLVAFIEDVMREMNSMCGKKDQSIDYAHEGPDMITQSDKILRNILLNLCSNASKYSPPGETIFIRSHYNEELLTISVQDHGIGIPEEDQKHMFTGYFRAGNVENIQGTGLGLSLVKKYVDLLNGNISFLSKHKEGTIFTLKFPLESIGPAIG